MESAIDWESFRLIVKAIYTNDSPRSRPNPDEGVMVKLLVLPSWYSLLDPELERQVADWISFQQFLG